MSEPLLLIDGNSLTYRAFFALPPDLRTSEGQVTNAVTGFCAMLHALLRDHRPSGVAVAFDRAEKTFRHQQLPSYKANRQKQPDILYEQLDIVREIVAALGILVVDAKGFEADDVLATLATAGRDKGEKVIIVSGDRDIYQLVEDPYIRVLYNKRGVSEYELYTEEGIKQKTGVDPAKYVYYAALRGDPSDNLPGVPGVGEKTAARLVNKYGDLDRLYLATGEQSPKLQENLEEYESQVRQNVELMRLVRDVPLGFGVDQLQQGEVRTEEVVRLFKMFELRNAQDRFGEFFEINFAPEAGSKSLDDQGTTSTNEVEMLLRIPSTASEALKDLSDLPGDILGLVGGCERFDGLAISASTGPGVWLNRELLTVSEVSIALAGLLDSTGPGFAFHDGKPLLKFLRTLGVVSALPVVDIRLAAYLLDSGDSEGRIQDLLVRYTRWRLPAIDSLEGQLDLEETASGAHEVAGMTARGIALLAVPMLDALEKEGLGVLNSDIELPLLRVLAKMEEVGIGVDTDELTRLRDSLTSECERLRESIHQSAGKEFNVNSTKQLREILFTELGLTPGKKTKTGYSTDASTLERLRGEHPIVAYLLAYREVEKLRSTYGEGLLAEVEEDCRIRATFNQTVARTGRLSSDAPNLHNIPVRTEAGRAFRRAFVPAAGCTLVVADYNQIELRCIAHLSEDPGLLAAFEAGNDIHTSVAAETWGITRKEVTAEMRSRAKMISYGLAYGMEAYGLSRRLGVPVEEASEILENYFSAFPSVREYMHHTVMEAKQRGYTETLFGRRRHIPELSSPNFNVRQTAERQAMNAGIQGLAADIFKVSLVRLDDYLESSGMSSRLVLQVHDEVILEVVPEELQEVEKLVPELLSDAYELKVRLAVDLSTGPTWADAKGKK